MVPGAARALQVPAPRRLRRNPEDVDRQGAEIRPARASKAHRRKPSLAMRADAWPQYCRAALVRSVSAAAARFPGPGEEAPERVHDVRKTLKEARAIARLFLHCVGEPARVTIAALAVDAPPDRARARSRRDGASPPASRAAARGRRAADGGDRARAGGGAARPPRPCRQSAARQAQRDRQAPRGMGFERGRQGRDRRRASRAPIGRRSGAGAVLSRATIRRRCMRFAPASSICATSSRSSPAPGRKR